MSIKLAFAVGWTVSFVSETVSLSFARQRGIVLAQAGGDLAVSDVGIAGHPLEIKVQVNPDRFGMDRFNTVVGTVTPSPSAWSKKAQS